ncbi:MAG: family 10 glycosylhydrolase [Bacteroidota bacterium]
MRRFAAGPSPLFCLLYFSILVPLAVESSTPNPSKQEVRAVWIATTSGLDWPKSTDPDEQRRSLLEMFENISRARLNTVFFQVRTRGDAMYRSAYEPWSATLTGTLGRNPGWDPLEFAIAEAHKRGLELHAWFNTFNVKNGPASLPRTRPPHVIHTHPEWVKQYGGGWWMDPAIPGARDYLVGVVMDLVRKYELDGIQFDFIRYPGNNYDDDVSYRRYGGSQDREDWRRENITAFVRTVYDSIITVKPMMKVGSTPIGIYENIADGNGLEGRNVVFQDSRTWLKEQKHDYLAPQIYWNIGTSEMDPDFSSLVFDWQTNSYDRHIYPGVGAYKAHVLKEIRDEIDVVRSAKCAGVSFFRYEFVANLEVFGDRFRTRANIPPMPWKDNTPPLSPWNLLVTEMEPRNFLLSWSAPMPARDGDTAKYYNIYRSTSETVNIDDPMILVYIAPTSSTSYLDVIDRPTAVKYYYTVTALDKGHNESLPAIVKAVTVEEIAEFARMFSFENSLGQNYSDPERTVTFIPYSLEDTSSITLVIHDHDGAAVRTLVDAVMSPGQYVAALDLRFLPPGEYTYRLQAREAVLVRRMRIVSERSTSPL